MDEKSAAPRDEIPRPFNLMFAPLPANPVQSAQPAKPLRAGDPCPKCNVERLDYDGLLNLACPKCGPVQAGGCFS